MKMPLILAASLSLAAAGVAFAAEEGTPQQTAPAASEQTAPEAGQAPAAAAPAIPANIRARFEKLDRNKDGYIDAKEARHMRTLHREFKHVAKSGKMNEADFAAWEEHRTQKHMKTQKREHAPAMKEKPAE
ncbi:MAG: EF-hand domain-containing protein [Gammaproteobacteria bacterium]